MAFKEKVYHKEERCLNCDYPLIDKYCGHCGQKAFLHKDSFWHMAAHFVGDYFHYHSKFWITLKTLVLKPGVVTLEFIQGKRVKYLNPIQLYIFVTTVFFLIFIFVANSESPKSSIEITDSSSITIADSLKLTKLEQNESDQRVFGLGPISPKQPTLKEYDSIQQSISIAERDGYLLKKIRRNLYVKANETKEERKDKLWEKVNHNAPKMFFILLPFFALILTVLFRKKGYYFVDHLLFSLHFHSFLFIILSIELILEQLWDNNFYGITLNLLLPIIFTVYLFLMLKKVYPSPAWKIFIKQCLLFFMYVIGFFFTGLLLIISSFLFL